MLENHGFDMSLVDGLKGGDPFLDYLFKDIIISILCRQIFATSVTIALGL